MQSSVRFGGAVALLVLAAVLVGIGVRRNGWRGTPASLRERFLIYLPVTVCVFLAGVLLLGL